jgi:NAD(P)-dependent dehydrogenase (short-subunit alcohol dehydrogenase family)
MNRLKDKVAVITGANSGIGAATAELFAKEGASVVIVDLYKDNFYAVADRIIAGGGEAIAIPANVTSMEDCKNAFSKTVEKYGKVDILVNCAGVGDFSMPLIRCTDEIWNRLVSIDQTGVFYFCREALKYMEEAKSGSIVNVASIAGVQGNAGIAYSAAKHAVVGMTKNVAIQYAGKGIRCNAICPGPTDTGMMNEEVEKLMDQEMWQTVSKHQCVDIPPAMPIDQAYAVLFFASDEARALTGQIVVVDGGRFL